MGLHEVEWATSHGRVYSTLPLSLSSLDISTKRVRVECLAVLASAKIGNLVAFEAACTFEKVKNEPHSGITIDLSALATDQHPH